MLDNPWLPCLGGDAACFIAVCVDIKDSNKIFKGVLSSGIKLVFEGVFVTIWMHNITFLFKHKCVAFPENKSPSS